MMSMATVEARGISTDPIPQFRKSAAVVSIVPLREAKTGRARSCCSTCSLRHVCLPRALGADEFASFEELTRVKRRVARGVSLYRAGDAFESLYAIRSGSFKSIAVTRAGVEKLTGVHLPGELLGLQAISENRHGYDAVALEDSEVCAIPYRKLTALALQHPQLQQQLLRLVSSDISRDEGLLLLLGGMDAGQRIAALLLSLSRRYERLGYASSRFNVRMTRDDIGSYLGLTLETVSRHFSRLQREGVIECHGREVELKNPAALRERADH